MVNPAIIDWIKKQEAKGYTSQQIYLHLVNNGYDQKDVIEAVNMSNAMSGNPGGYRMQNQAMPNSGMQNNQSQGFNSGSNKSNSNAKSHTGLIVVLIVLLVLGGGGYYAYSSGIYVEALDFVKMNLGQNSQATNTNTPSDISNSQNTIPDQTASQGTQDPGAVIVDGPTVSELVAQSQSDTSKENIDDITGLAISSDCNEYADKLMSCTPYVCTLKEPVMDGDVTVRIIGFVDGKCRVTSDLYDGVTQECNYDEEFRQKAAAESAEAAKAQQEGREPPDPNDPNSVTSQAYDQGICVIEDNFDDQ